MTQENSDQLRELIRILVRNLGILEKNDASCCSVTVGQCHAIVEIGRVGIISLTDLSDLIGVDKSTMSRTINNLVEESLVIRDIDENNRRYVNIQLTDGGKTIFDNIEKTMATYYQGIFDAIPEDKRDQVLESLQILKDAVKKHKCC
ncbi:MAG: Transcriptional regulator [Clostridiales bacterium 38_11]|nr:MAG: Transcriptional regulator [Clostridiales bacterium 38_11]HBH12421.1 MarR family transcriptional regulator [Clostridiales bacterium]